jgi:hypothetical protein
MIPSRKKKKGKKKTTSKSNSLKQSTMEAHCQKHKDDQYKREKESRQEKKYNKTLETKKHPLTAYLNTGEPPAGLSPLLLQKANQNL